MRILFSCFCFLFTSFAASAEECQGCSAVFESEDAMKDVEGLELLQAHAAKRVTPQEAKRMAALQTQKSSVQEVHKRYSSSERDPEFEKHLTKLFPARSEEPTDEKIRFRATHKGWIDILDLYKDGFLKRYNGHDSGVWQVNKKHQLLLKWLAWNATSLQSADGGKSFKDDGKDQFSLNSFEQPAWWLKHFDGTVETQEQDLALVDMHGIIKPHMNGKKADLSEIGYKTVVSFRDNLEMQEYIRRVVKSMNMTILNSGGITGMAPYYSGVKTWQSLKKLKSELTDVAMGMKEQQWVVYNVLGDDAALDEDGYQLLATLNDQAEMEKYIGRVIDSLGLKVVKEHGLKAIVPYYNGISSGRNFSNLTMDLATASIAPEAEWISVDSSKAALDEDGYHLVAMLKDNAEMEKYMLRVVDDMNLKLINEGGLKGILPYYSGVKTWQSLKKLRQELKDAAHASALHRFVVDKDWSMDKEANGQAPDLALLQEESEEDDEEEADEEEEEGDADLALLQEEADESTEEATEEDGEEEAGAEEEEGDAEETEDAEGSAEEGAEEEDKYGETAEHEADSAKQTVSLAQLDNLQSVVAKPHVQAVEQRRLDPKLGGRAVTWLEMVQGLADEQLSPHQLLEHWSTLHIQEKAEELLQDGQVEAKKSTADNHKEEIEDKEEAEDEEETEDEEGTEDQEETEDEDEVAEVAEVEEEGTEEEEEETEEDEDDDSVLQVEYEHEDAEEHAEEKAEYHAEAHAEEHTGEQEEEEEEEGEEEEEVEEVEEVKEDEKTIAMDEVGQVTEKANATEAKDEKSIAKDDVKDATEKVNETNPRKQEVDSLLEESDAAKHETKATMEDVDFEKDLLEESDVEKVRFRAKHRDWIDIIDLYKDGFFARYHDHDAGIWHMNKNNKIVLKWLRWGEEELESTDGGKSFNASGDLKFSLKSYIQPVWWSKHFDGTAGAFLQEQASNTRKSKSDQATATVDTQKIIRAHFSGSRAPLDEPGYAAVAMLKDDAEMKTYIRRVVGSLDLAVAEEGGLDGIVPYYSGLKTWQTLEKMKSEIRDSAFKEGGTRWVVQQDTGLALLQAGVTETSNTSTGKDIKPHQHKQDKALKSSHQQKQDKELKSPHEKQEMLLNGSSKNVSKDAKPHHEAEEIEFEKDMLVESDIEKIRFRARHEDWIDILDLYKDGFFERFHDHDVGVWYMNKKNQLVLKWLKWGEEALQSKDGGKTFNTSGKLKFRLKSYAQPVWWLKSFDGNDEAQLQELSETSKSKPPHLDMAAIIGAHVNGRKAGLNQQGYEIVSLLKDNAEMTEYIRRVITDMGMVVTNEGGLHGIVPFYSGVNTFQTLAQLKEELLRTARKPSGDRWVMDQNGQDPTEAL